MATIKNHTDLPQSKKLAEILPIESADTLHCIDFDGDLLFTVPKQYSGSFRYQPELIIPCWSLAALLDVFDNEAGLAKEYDLWFCYDNGKSYCTKHYINAIDACYEMILKLKEQNLL